MMVDWKAIRPFNGSRSAAFEELCVQLARAETPPDGIFTRKGSPDAGVECFTVLPDGREWGWQAKYLSSLGKSQFGQFDQSVKAALAGHPNLVRYFICVPRDRPDACTAGRRSALQRWNDHVKKWETWAEDRDHPIEFIWWGSSELVERLAHPTHIGRLRFWFGDLAFDQAWLESRLQTALRAAGPRYTPDLHVEPSIGSDLEIFGRATSCIDSVKERAKLIRTAVNRIVGVTDSANDERTSALECLRDAVDGSLQALRDLLPDPVAELPFWAIREQFLEAQSAAHTYRERLSQSETAYRDRQAEDIGASAAYRGNSFTSEIAAVRRLQRELGQVVELTEHIEGLANKQVLILTGAAGTGKTHLLCDIARKRIEEGSPTVILMGQRFLSTAEPWNQARDQLDVPGAGLDEFVGALEAAAQVAHSRALLIIDAINEGCGRTIWKPHLASLLQSITVSPWIGVVLSVRSPYEKQLISDETHATAAAVTHRGFGDREYDAIRAFFSHYGLELPSGPLLQPEFRNPLFLKTVCEGLKMAGKRHLPSGFHGITKAFDLYLKGANKRLAELLGYDPHDPLVTQALTKIAELIATRPHRRLTRHDARSEVNTLWSDLDYERTLYRGLVSEGILTEHLVESAQSECEDVVYISYERYADHAIANVLLERHLDLEEPAAAFGDDGGLAFLYRERRYTTNGLLEALCIQLPERTGKELMELAPAFATHRGVREAFRQSLIWRDVNAFSPITFDIMRKLVRTEDDLHATLEAMVTVASLPMHPLNADRLHDDLRRHSMPDRDARWSIYLHQSYGERGAVDRLIDWSLAVSEEDDVPEATVLLCATALIWMFTTSHRFLRDRATKAVVVLLSGRLGAAEAMLRRFENVDDLYVRERLYAVIYGLAMRTSDPTAVTTLPRVVYDQVFANGTPPAHVLLRDYARGLVERALHLGSTLDVDRELIRPPYQSTWPQIMTESEFEAREATWRSESDGDGIAGYAQNRIIHSVMMDDFGDYIIGRSLNWLPYERSQPRWRSWEERVDDWVECLSNESREAWKRLLQSPGLGLRGAIQMALDQLGEALSAEERSGIEILLADPDARTRSVPRFDRALIQRYVVARVFELGWTSERFGDFDEFAVSSHGRDAQKAERIGKKYQWIAYHEMLAYLTDHYQYWNQRGSEDRGMEYDGPWQEYMRDIDPSMTLASKAGGTGFGGHTPSWWGPEEYTAWEEELSDWEWIKREDDWPNVEQLLTIQKGATGAKWLNVAGFFCWRQEHPVDVEAWDVRRRDLWIMTNGYYVEADRADDFMTWAENMNFWGRWLPNVAELDEMFVGEYGWSPAYKHMDRLDEGVNPWTSVGRGCPTALRTAAVRCSSSPGSHDCSMDEGSFWLQVPDPEFVRKTELRWTGKGTDFVGENGMTIAFDPTAWEQGPTGLLVRTDAMTRYLEASNLTLCWTVLGEKRILSGIRDRDFPGALQISGAYRLKRDGPAGFLNYNRVAPFE